MDRLMSMRVFQTVIDQGGFSAAARALDMSSAAVTRLIADLEDYLGTRLLHRTTRRISLSPAGETYLGRVRDILHDIDAAHEAASSQTHELSGVLRILAPPVLASHVLAPLVMGFNAKYPDITLHIDVETFKEPPIEDYDVTLLPTEGHFDADIIARKVSSTEAVLVASPKYLQRKGAPQRPQDLGEHDILRLKLPGQAHTQWRLLNADDADAVQEVDIRPRLLANHSDTLLRAAMDGAGITSAPVDLVAPLLNSGALVRVLAPWIAGRLSLYAALPSRKFLPERTSVFLDYLIEQTRQQSDSAMRACVLC